MATVQLGGISSDSVRYLESDLAIFIFEHDRAWAAQLNGMVRAYAHIVPTMAYTEAYAEHYLRSPHRPTLFLLDIVSQNDDEPGKRLARHIRSLSTCTTDRFLFVTGYPVNVLDDITGSQGAMFTVNKLSPRFAALFADALSLSLTAMHNAVIRVTSYHTTTYLRPQDINYICLSAADPHKVEFVTTKALRLGPVSIRATLSYIKRALPQPPFVPAHRSYVANTQNILTIQPGSSQILFRDGASCPYSSKSGFKQYYEQSCLPAGQ